MRAEHAALAEIEGRLFQTGLEGKDQNAGLPFHLEDAEKRGEPDLVELPSEAGDLDGTVDRIEGVGEGALDRRRASRLIKRVGGRHGHLLLDSRISTLLIQDGYEMDVAGRSLPGIRIGGEGGGLGGGRPKLPDRK